MCFRLRPLNPRRKPEKPARHVIGRYGSNASDAEMSKTMSGKQWRSKLNRQKELRGEEELITRAEQERLIAFPSTRFWSI